MSRTVAAKSNAISLDPKLSAREAGLRYVSDGEPGFTRIKRGKGFIYRDARGKVVRDGATLRRIGALVIPPAWTDVWICAHENGHLQATGRDARGRKQYRYHARFRAQRDETKYHKTFAFAAALPRIRARCQRDLKQPQLTHDKVVAAVVCLLERTLIRVGNEEYSRLNDSFGLTTLRDRHARIHGAEVKFCFRGKSGKEHCVTVRDRQLARIVKRCRDLPGDELFQYVDENGEQHGIGSGDVNTYLREVAGDDFTAKDFRTWAGTVRMAIALREAGAQRSVTHARKRVVQAINETAQALGNTPAVCKRCYVHPLVLDAYARGEVVPALRVVGRESGRGLGSDERAVLAFLKRLQTRNAREHGPNGLLKLLQKSVAQKKKKRAS
jgi:DNA topoisomerase-1